MSKSSSRETHENAVAQACSEWQLRSVPAFQNNPLCQPGFLDPGVCHIEHPLRYIDAVDLAGATHRSGERQDRVTGTESNLEYHLPFAWA